MKVLVVDDNKASRVVLRQFLEFKGFEVIEAESGEEALEKVEKEKYDVILMDVNLPGIGGIEAVKEIKSKPESPFVIMITSYGDEETMKLSAKYGADDYLTKPINLLVLLSKLNSYKENLAFYQSKARIVEKQKNKLKELLNLSEKLLKENETLTIELIQLLYKVAEFRDDETHEHTMRVGWLSGRLAETLGLDADEATEVQLAAPFHDIGKIGIPDRILLKPGRLTEEEFEFMKRHAWIGYSILKTSSSSIMKKAAVIAYTHHERWDGSGYPRGLSGKDIPLEGRIVAVSDSFDAMVSKRVYKEARPLEDAMKEIKRLKGKQYCPDVVEAFEKLEDEIIEHYRYRMK